MKPLLCTVLAAAACLTPGAGATQTSIQDDATVVTVNGAPIRVSQVRLMMQNLAAQLGQELQEIDQQELFQAATQQAIDTKLLAQEARRREITVDAAAVDGIMVQIEQQAGGRESLDGFLQGMGLDYDEFKADVAESMLVQNLIEQQIRSSVEVTDQEVVDFYTGNPQMFQRPDQVRARHILIVVEEGSDEPTKADARGRAEAARKRAIEGEDFAALATELSEGPSAPNGGDLGFFSADRMVKPFSDVAFALEPGAISEVVETQFGYHVIKVEERRAASTQPLDEVNEQLRNALVEREVGEGVTSLIERLRSEATIVPTTGQAGGETDAG